MRGNYIWHNRNLQIFYFNLWHIRTNIFWWHHQKIILVPIWNLFSQEGHLYIYVLRTREALELILGQVHVSMYPSQKKKFVVDFTSTVCLLLNRLYGSCDYSHGRGSLWLYWAGKSRCTVILARHLLSCIHAIWMFFKC